MKMSLKVLKQTARGSRECCKGIQKHSCNTVRKALLFASPFAQRQFNITFVSSLHTAVYKVGSPKRSDVVVRDVKDPMTVQKLKLSWSLFLTFTSLTP